MVFDLLHVRDVPTFIYFTHYQSFIGITINLGLNKHWTLKLLEFFGYI